ncbi:hypothetical protein DE146DRAFT_637336 [Phaeosphaeria sp. MPI-PUGE-AT-0046c]|nr:hypothetical protein DE146DRAFT_637336 [Phaeosphaeria sp. MPI-PUGE-AT-0046c]
MDLTATLTAAETEALSSYTGRSLQGAEDQLARVCDRSVYKNEGAFEKSLRIKNTLDVVEGNSQPAPTGHDLAVMINGEYQLWRLNSNTALKHNPFLSHWVEALQRIGRPDIQGKDATPAPGSLSADTIKLTRVLLIEKILQDEDITKWAGYAPEKVASQLLSRSSQRAFNLQPYVRMLEDEGIYERTPEPEAPAYTHTSANAELSPEEYLQRQKDDILGNLTKEPQTAIFDMTRLPITLTHLDFLTTILTDRTLEKHAIDPAPVITQYIQHALRTVERMDKPPSPSSEVSTEQAHSDGEVLEYGKEAQSRCILLLLLFIKSLIRKQVVELDVLFYEIAEITVRYVWIKEVRDFRTWVEEGREVEGHGGG